MEIIYAVIRSSKVAPFVLSLFALPFCGFGLFALASGVRQLREGSPRPTIMPLLFGLVFALAGFGALAGVWLETGRQNRKDRLQAENPTAPWMRRVDWAQGRCNSKTKSTMISAWVFAFFWNMVSAPIVYFMPLSTFQKRPVALVGLLFPAAGIGLLIWAVRETLAWLEFGKTYFEMNSVPGVIGRELRGNIYARFPRPPDHGIRLKLSCVNRVVNGSGKDQSVKERIEWRAEKLVSPGEFYSSPTGTMIPVSLHIPCDAAETDSQDSRNQIVWMLEADADVPGVDYKNLFEVPIFRTKDSPSEAEANALASSQPAIDKPPNPAVIVSLSSSGMEFYFPAARNRGFAVGATVFFLLWSGIIAIMIKLGAPFIFPFFFLVFDLIMFYVILQLWLGTSRVLVSTSGVGVRTGLLGGGEWHDIPVSQISAIQALITAQQGGASGTPFYSIQLVQKDGKKVVLGQTIRDKQESDWLVQEMGKALGLGTGQGRAIAAN
ncbi:MAG: hypothetical protein DMG69_08605 [Acidobacteria bacterium]|nr:MAG: hypothetical protein DMG69_08605 [Acidobacteriota bacterium]